MPLPSPLFSESITARNRRQALDWSLVLASQQIEHRIEHDEQAGWSLIVATVDRDRALAQIHQYQLENKRWRWRRPAHPAGTFFDASSLVWVFLNLVFYLWSEQRADLRWLGMMNGTALSQGEWWRLFTATWLHANLAHLAGNLVFGSLFLGLIMGRFGPGVGLLAAYLAGVGGNLIAWCVYDESQLSLGASGVVMGALGLLVIQSPAFLKRPNGNTFRLFTASIMAGFLLLVFLGTSPGADVVAHFGGFFCGLLEGLVLALVPRLVHRSRVNLAAALVFVVLIILPWWWALMGDRAGQ